MNAIWYSSIWIKPKKKREKKINRKIPFRKLNVPKFETKNKRKNFFLSFIHQGSDCVLWISTHIENTSKAHKRTPNRYPWMVLLKKYFFSHETATVHLLHIFTSTLSRSSHSSSFCSVVSFVVCACQQQQQERLRRRIRPIATYR